MVDPQTPVSFATCAKRHGRLWKFLGGFGAFALMLLTLCLGAYSVSYDAKAQGQKAEAATERLKVEVDAQGDVLSEIRLDVRETRNDVKTILRNGKGQ